MERDRPDTEAEKVVEMVRHHLLCVAQHVLSRGSYATQALPQYVCHCHYIVTQQLAASSNIITHVPVFCCDCFSWELFVLYAVLQACSAHLFT